MSISPGIKSLVDISSDLGNDRKDISRSVKLSEDCLSMILYCIRENIVLTFSAPALDPLGLKSDIACDASQSAASYFRVRRHSCSIKLVTCELFALMKRCASSMTEITYLLS